MIEKFIKEMEEHIDCDDFEEVQEKCVFQKLMDFFCETEHCGFLEEEVGEAVGWCREPACLY